MPQVLRWDRRFRLSIGARPWPHFRRRDETRRHGVLFNVASGPVQSFCSPDPVIPGFVLPERLTSSSEQPVGGPGGGSFEPAHKQRRWHNRRYQNMYVVRHHHPRVELIEQTSVFAISDRVRHKQGNSRIGQPSWTGSCPVELPILGNESVSRPKVGFQNLLPSYDRQRSEQTPSDEQSGAFRLKVRQVSSVYGHIASGQAKAPVPPSVSVRGRRNSQEIFGVVGL